MKQVQLSGRSEIVTGAYRLFVVAYSMTLPFQMAVACLVVRSEARETMSRVRLLGANAATMPKARSTQGIDSLFRDVKFADSIRPKDLRLLDTILVNRPPGNRVEEQVLPHRISDADVKRYVFINASALAPAGDQQLRRSVTLNISPGRTFRATISRRYTSLEKATIWEGTVDRPAAGGPASVTLVQVDSVLSGAIRIADTIFTIRHYGNRIHEIERVRQSGFDPERPPRPPRSEADGRGFDRAPLETCAPQVVDVLVVVTPFVLDSLKGYSAVVAQAELATRETNAALTYSGVEHQVRLAGVMVTQYRGEGNIDADLDRIQNVADDFMDEVITSRRTLKADVVSLWVESTNAGVPACGLGNLITAPQVGRDRAFFVVRRNCAVGYFSFGHELGHLLGSNHDRSNAALVAALPYAFGYTDPSGRFRDIMSYKCGSSCPRLQFFSTTAASGELLNHPLIQGRPLGIAYETDSANAANVAQAVKFTMCYASKYY